MRVNLKPRQRNSDRQNDGKRHPQHLQWVRGRPCLIDGVSGHVCTGRMEAHHVKETGNGGMGVKPADHWVVPLCSGAHDLVHRGPISFEKKYGVNLVQAAMQYAVNSPHRKLWENDR